MEVEYRRMRAEDEYQAFKLWADTFGEGDAEISRHYLAPDPDYLDHTLLAAFPDGTIAATLHYWLYEMRDAEGKPQFVGAISHVTTREEHRRKGYAAKLLEWAFEDMAANRCEWTLLFSSKMGVPLYEQNGFRLCSHPFKRGLLSREYPPNDPAYTISKIEEADAGRDWSFLAPIYSAYNDARPLSRVRDARYWQTYFPAHIEETLRGNRGVVYTATAEDGTLCAYIIAHFSTHERAQKEYQLDQVFTISEVSALSEHHAAIPQLLSAAVKDTMDGMVGGQLLLPMEEPILSTASVIYGPDLHEWDDRSMYARPLAAGVSYEDIQAIFAAPGAIFWRIDDF
ncbi:MAG: GNAT family N-acetyltransferase [Chloroflexia bacterium]